MTDSEIAIMADHLVKEYELGVIGSGTLRRDLQSKMAARRGLEDPNQKLGVETRHGILRAVDDVSFTIKRGERIGLIGRNGAGKSTLLKLLCRITAPTEGRVGINGKVTSMLEVGTGFHPELTGRENVYLNGAILGMNRKQVDRRFDKILEFSEVEQAIDTPVKRYSSGMYVRLAFAVSAHLDSDIVVMDEVLAVGDLAFQEKCISRMRQIAQDEQRTVLYVSHNMETVAALCDRCFILDKGKITFDGDVYEAEALYRANIKSNQEYDYTDGRLHLGGTTTDARIIGLNSLTGDSPLLDTEFGVHVTWEYAKTLENLNLRIEFRDYRDKPVASKLFYDIGNGKAGETREGDFHVDISSLQNGDYHTRFVLFQVSSTGIGTLVDMVDGYNFTINSPERDTPLVWRNDWWGHIRL